MSHYAKIENDIVTEVIVAEQDFIDTLTGFWVQTSYTGSIRKNYAGIGFTYDSIKDVFIAPQPFTSWVFNETTCGWNAPVDIVDDGKEYRWDEATTNWKEVI
jgi:hypothetical protein